MEPSPTVEFRPNSQFPEHRKDRSGVPTVGHFIFGMTLAWTRRVTLPPPRRPPRPIPFRTPNSQLISLPFAPALAAGEMSRVVEDLEAVGGAGSDYQPPEERPSALAAKCATQKTRIGRHFDLFAGLRRDEVGQADVYLKGRTRQRAHVCWPTGSVLSGA